ncbi:MAG TPA: hypothetical protein P5092_14285 [Ruminococcus sp.]|nr:hypothetical protein [Ruminococcus sp.]
MKTEKNRKLHGSVLLTVVAVMALLIIFMTGTLVLANAANRRSHRSYTSSQAEYTARAAIDAFYRSTEDNTAIRDAVLNLGSTATYANVDFGAGYNNSLGRLVDPDGSGTHDGQIRIEQLHDAAGDPITQWKWNPSPEDPSDHTRTLPARWEEFNVIRVTATVQVGQRGARKTVYQDYLANPTTFTPVTPPPPPVSPTALDGFQTIGDSAFNLTGGTLATPVILGLGNSDRTHEYTPQNSSETYSSTFFVNGDLHTQAELHMHIDDYTFQNVITRDFYCDNQLWVHVDYDASALPAGWTQKDVPYFFVNGTFHYNESQLMMGSDQSSSNKAPFNVFMGTADITCTGPVIIAGDLYLMDDDGDSVIVGASNSRLYSWTDSMADDSGSQFVPINQGGGIYSKGSLTYKGGGEIQGDVRIEDDLTIENKDPLTISGNLVARNIVLNAGEAGPKEVRIEGGSAVFCDSLTGTNTEAIQAIQASGLLFSYDDFLASHPEGVYPDTMTREAIYGQDPATSSDLEELFAGFVEPNPDTKIIKNQTELLRAVGYDPVVGDFDGYYTSTPTTVPVQNRDNTYNQATFNGEAGRWTNGSGSVVYFPADYSASGTIEITPSGAGTEFWIVIGEEGETTTWNPETRLIIDDSACTVNIMILGDFQLGDRSCILNSTLGSRISGQTNIDYVDQNTDKVNIMIYGGTGTEFRFGSQCVVSANAYAPYMNLVGTITDGWKVNDYINKYGTSPNWLGSGHSVQWIGNSLFNGLVSPFNNFSFLKLDAGA